MAQRLPSRRSVNPGPNHFRRDIVVIGGSAGAIQALTFIDDLPHRFPAAVFLVVHLSPRSPGLLPNVLQKHSKIPVANAYNGEPISAGRIYVAPPDHHLIVRDGSVEVSHGPKENRHRPSIDVLFRSAANVHGSRVIGVILSGWLNDGSAGLAAVRAQGGLGIVQDPDDALVPAMPANALAYAGADHCVPHAQLGSLLAQAVMEK